MRVVIQRVKNASVLINNNKTNSINKGYVIFLGFKNSDTIKDIEYIVNKIEKLRIFEINNKMNLSIKDINGEILLISQFTLYGDVRKNNRPSFTDCMEYEKAKELYNVFIEKLKETNISFKTGEFGSDMEVSLVNNGPVTIIIDSNK
jgi:D-tyrosyl-tRNA(Tyr) deacylase